MTGWQCPAKPKFSIKHLNRVVKGNSVPVPKTLLKFMLTAVVPRILQRSIMTSLPPEVGRVLLEAGKGFHIAGGTSPLSQL